jgi:hypothetical protein
MGAASREVEPINRFARIGSERPFIGPEPARDISVGVCQEDHQRPKEYWESTANTNKQRASFKDICKNGY